jgi:hypothetical protein
MRRMTKTIALALLFAAGSVAAEVDGKKTEKGFGELLRGMGQEIDKAGKKASSTKKNDAKKDAAKPEKKD